MNTPLTRPAVRMGIAVAALAAVLGLPGCTSDGYSGDGGGSTSVGVSVGYGYGGYYGGYGGYYAPYPPVVVVPPDQRPDRPDSGNRPTTLPSDAGGSAAQLQP